MNNDFPIANDDAITLLRIISLKLKLKADQNIKSLNINSTQGRVLAYIYGEQDKGIIQKDIANFFNKKNATITSMLQGLEKKGYITRHIPKDNERQKNIFLTEKGNSIILDSRKIFSDLESEFNSILTAEELETLSKLLVKLNDNL